jgi:hypothetical protein
MSVKPVIRKILEDMFQRRIAAGGKIKMRKSKGGLPVGGKKKRVKKGGLTSGGLRVGGKKKAKKSVKKSVKKQKGGANPWMSHLMKVKRANPHLSLSEAMVKAKKSY